MIIKILLSFLPVIFLTHLFTTDYLQSKKGIKQDGKAPINKHIFFGSKYAVLLIWSGMLLEIWNVTIPGSFQGNPVTKITGIALWIAGFLFLYTGKLSLGKSFRIGVANEKTDFIASGIYRISRNPMYVGLFLTFSGCMIYSLHFIYILISLFVIAVHHRITLAEEKELTAVYGDPYCSYCKQVRRYL